MMYIKMKVNYIYIYCINVRKVIETPIQFRISPRVGIVIVNREYTPQPPIFKINFRSGNPTE